eukprot:Sdes_comp19883_c0_seq1m12197
MVLLFTMSISGKCFSNPLRDPQCSLSCTPSLESSSSLIRGIFDDAEFVNFESFSSSADDCGGDFSQNSESAQGFLTSFLPLRQSFDFFLSTIYFNVSFWHQRETSALVSLECALNSLTTGDILLLRSPQNASFPKINSLLDPDYCHTVMVLKPPHFFGHFDKELSGKFLVLDPGFSGDADCEDTLFSFSTSANGASVFHPLCFQDSMFGVRLTELNRDFLCKFSGKISYRRLISPEKVFGIHRQSILNSKLRKLYPLLYQDPRGVDPMNFMVSKLVGFYQNQKNVAHLHFSSALIAYMYDKFGILCGKGFHQGWASFSYHDFMSCIDSCTPDFSFSDILSHEIFVGLN